MVSVVQPKTKRLAFSSASATARASPSIGAYRDSANLLPTKVICHPSLQQKRWLEGQRKCFWKSR